MAGTLKLQDLPHQDVLESLTLISEDIEAHPESFTPLDTALVERVRDLIRDVEIDLDAPLSPFDE